MMKLSEAIRAGSMLKPQGFGPLSGHPSAPFTCALGAAYEAVGMKRLPMALTHLPISWMRIFAVTSEACPACFPHVKVAMPWIIAHLNDGHAWTRSQIADWVETIEVLHPESQEVPVTDESEKGESVLCRKLACRE